MKEFDLIITNGTIVDPLNGISNGDIAISDGRIAGHFKPDSDRKAAEVIDATGMHVFPGLIDAHVHFGFAEPVTEYTSETVYAAQGGFTSILGYFLSNSSYKDVFESEFTHAIERSHVDFGFHFSVANESHLQEMDDYVREFGVNSFKYFMNFIDDTFIF